MRKVEQHVIGAFVKGESARMGNTDTDGRELRLHGHVIARWNVLGGDRFIEGTLAGWPTVTTRSRLNALASLIGGVGVYQHKHEQYTSDGNPLDPHQWYVVSVSRM